MGNGKQRPGEGGRFPVPTYLGSHFMESEVWRLGSSGVRRSGVSEAPFGSLFFMVFLVPHACLVSYSRLIFCGCAVYQCSLVFMVV